MLLALFLGGIMICVTVPVSSVCLIADDVNGQMLDDISGVLSLNISGDQGIMTKDMVDKCFNNPNKTENPYLLDIIFTRNETTNQKVTLRKSIVDDTKTKLDAQFNAITAKMGVGALDLSTDPNIVKLKTTLRNTNMGAMMLANPQSLASDVRYQAMASDPRCATDQANCLSSYWGAGCACPDFVVPADMGSLSGNTIKGVSSFATYMANDFSNSPNPVIPTPACARQVLCKDAAVTPQG